jgi:hypothetical protein
LGNKYFRNRARAAPKTKVKNRHEIEPNFWLDFNTSAVPDQRFCFMVSAAPDRRFANRPAPLLIASLIYCSNGPTTPKYFARRMAPFHDNRPNTPAVTLEPRCNGPLSYRV